MATRETDGARWERLPPSFRASRGFAARARVCTPLTKPEEKERLLAVYIIHKAIFIHKLIIIKAFISIKRMTLVTGQEDNICSMEKIIC